MRGVGPVPVMSPMSKYRKHERSTSKTRKNGQTAEAGGESKKQKLDSQRATNGSSGGKAADSGGAGSGGGGGDKKSGGHRTSNNQRASLDSSSNRTFALRTPKIVKVTAGENDHGCNSPVANSFSLPSNASQTQQPSVSSPSFSTTPGQANSATPGPGEENPPRQGAVRRRRRPYVDVRLREGDESRILGYRIKVWWPLDKKWYTGEVRDYDSLQQRHWIIYDDHEHEWLRLADECFKLQLVPGDDFESPGLMKDAQRQRSSSRGRRPRGASSKTKQNSVVDDHSSAVGAGPGSDQDENPSWRGVSGDSSAKLEDNKPAFEKPLSVYTRRKRSKGTSAVTPDVPPAAPDEVQSPARMPEEPGVSLEGLPQHDHPAADESELGSSMVNQVAKDAVQGDATGMPPAASADEENKVGPSFVEGSRQAGGVGRRPGGLGLVYIDRWPLSRNVSELLRHVEVWSGGDRGSLVGSWVLNQVWRGLQPVWNIGPLFSLNFGTSTELHASGGLVQHGRLLETPVTSEGNSICMLHIEMGPVFSVSLSCEPAGLLDSMQNKQSCSSDDIHRPLAAHSSKEYDEKPDSSVASNLRQILKRRWKELHTKGLRLTFSESAAIMSSQYAHFMFRARSLNTEAAPAAEESDADSTVDARVGVHELLSLSKKGRRSVKGQKRVIAQVTEEANAESSQQNPAKRVRLEEQETVKIEECEDPKSYHSSMHSNVLKLTRCPSRKGMWCVAEATAADTEQQPSPSEPGRRRMLEYIDDEDIGDYEHDIYDELEIELGKEMDPGRSRSFNKRKRRRTENRRSPADYDPSPCTGNVLIVQSDRGWREAGATVELQSDGKSWALTVSLNGEVLYSLKVMQRINHGVSNKYTHAMMWKGGKDWILEFPDKMQWSQFRFMHDVCCDRNARASCVKHIPIPGVREVETEDLDEPYARPEAYIRTAGEMEAALSGDSVLYDLDQEDERWLQQVNSGARGASLSDYVFERLVHELERASYLRSEELPADNAVEISSGFCSEETARLIHSYWLERRKERGGPLIRCFQPLPWERYAAQVRAYEEAQRHPLTRQQASRPTPFAFCWRPIGLEAPNRPQRQRSQRRLMSRPLNPFDSSQFDYSDHPFIDDSPKSRDTVYLSPSYASLGQEKPTEGSPGLDIVDDGVYPPRIITKYRSKRKKLRKMKSISGTEELPSQPQPQLQQQLTPQPTTRLFRTTFVAPPTAMHLDNGGYIGDHCENDSCSSLEVDISDETIAAKAAYARKAARVAAAKAALAQELYAIADAKMNKAISCLIEAEAIAAVERAAREGREQGSSGSMVGIGDAGAVAAMRGFGDGEDRELEDEDLFLPIGGSCWTEEFGSGLIQRTSTTMPLEVQSPRIKQPTVGGLRTGRTVTGRATADGMVS